MTSDPTPPPSQFGPPGPPPGRPPGLPTGSPPPGVPEPRGKHRTGVVIGVVVALALAIGTGVAVALVSNHRADLAAQERRDEAAAEKEQAEKEAAEEEAAEAAAVAEQAAQEEADRAAAQAAYESCRTEINPFLEAMKDVDARLDVGLNQGDLSDLVGDASVAYNRMDIGALGAATCLAAAAKLETAFNAYAKTVNQWNDCIFDDDYCTLDDIDGDLQEQWLKASTGIDKAEEMLGKLDPANGGDGVGDQI